MMDEPEQRPTQPQETPQPADAERGFFARFARKSLESFQNAGKSSKWRLVLGVVVPVALLLAAYVALRGQDELNTIELFNKAKHAPWYVALILVLSAAGTITATAALFWVLIHRHGKVGFWEMVGVTLSSALLNYLPMRPGMIGRVGYHKLVNRISVKDNIKVLLWANALVILASVGLLAVCLACWFLGMRGDSWWFALFAFLPTGGFVLLGLHAKRVRPSADPEVFRPIMGMAIRWVELHIWAARFWAAFAVVGVDIGWGGALVLAAAHTAALMIPVSGNGLGLSEWFLGVGLMVMPASLSIAVVGNMEVGLAAGLVARGFEVVTLVPLGLIGGWFVRKRLMAARRDGSEHPESEIMHPLDDEPGEQQSSKAPKQQIRAADSES